MGILEQLLEAERDITPGKILSLADDDEVLEGAFGFTDFESREKDIRGDQEFIVHLNALAQGVGHRIESIIKIGSHQGIKRLSYILAIAKKYGISLALAEQLLDCAGGYALFSRNQPLQSFIQSFGEGVSFVSKSSNLTMRPVYINGGSGSSTGKVDGYFHMCDVHMCIFSDKDMAELPELYDPERTAKTESLAAYRTGSIGHIDFSLLEFQGELTFFILNGQARKAFWQLEPIKRRKYEKWYGDSIKSLETLCQSLGIKYIGLATGKMAQRWSEICFGHGVPQSLLDQFYDRFAEKRNFTHETGKLVHPLTGAYIENQFWLKDLQATA